MAHRIHPHMQAVQSSLRDPPPNLPPTQTQGKKLPPSHNPVLSLGKASDRPVWGVSLHLCVSRRHKCRLGGHALTVAAPASRVVRTGARMCDVLWAGSAFYCGLGCCRLGLADRGAL
jgi:hypothetical protein